ncbi:adenosylcobinamide-phosphate synthase CbiB [Roseobacter sinensis]|uniref:Cobalamin biosynthesis protein CobD n=1 Tax=Roseobacter sinensis TaxID=2931391 RepID=A0ABT3BE04_9RHOB|nr:adenosylcobinamide-phosphate synthase CbiB [Roseobacter sp. WL0113]MCV3271803.1 adenosylcobinamide-phosphate synthase CbiB [Roseobacter sp. WL0113]
MTTAALLIGALLLDAVLGEPRWLWDRVPHPAVLMGRLVGGLERLLNAGAARRAKGALCAVLLVLTGLLIGTALSWLGPLAEVLATAVLLAQRSLVEHVAEVADGLRVSLPEGRRAVARIVSRDTAAMDESQTARAAIESAAENLSDGVIAPAFWFLLAGLPGVITYKLINTGDSMIGYRTPRHEDFGWAVARLDDLLNLIPARLTAGLIALTGRATEARGIRSDARRHRSPNAGWPEAAMARALGIALAGPRAYDGTLRDFPFVNATGRKLLTPVDIDASIAMLWRAWALFVALCVVVLVLQLVGDL